MANTAACTRISLTRVCFFPYAIIFLALAGIAAKVARAGDDTARFYGTWEAHIQANGQIVTVISVHDASGFKNFVRQPSGDTPAGDGTFSAANGRYQTNAPSPNNAGVYYFLGND